MSLDALLARLERCSVTVVTPAAIPDVQLKPPPILACTPVTLVTAESDEAINACWQELESLLAIVGPAYNTPAHEYAELQDAARHDLDNALIAFREMARQLR